MKFDKVFGVALSILASCDGSFAVNREKNDIENLGIVVCPLSQKMYRYSIHYEPDSLKFDMSKVDGNQTMFSQLGNDISIITSEMVTARIKDVQMKFNVVNGSIRIKCANINNIKVSSPINTYEYDNELMLSFPVVTLEVFYSHINTIDVRNFGLAITSGYSEVRNISVKNATLFNIINYGKLSIGKIDANCNKLQFFNFAKLEDLTVNEASGHCKQLVFNKKMVKIKKKNLAFRKAHFERKGSK